MQNEEPATELYKWLQTEELNDKDNGAFSPGFVSMHPAGGKVNLDENGEKIWTADKSKWPAQEGSLESTKENSLTVSLTEICERNAGINSHYIALVNGVALHKCSSYCLKRKKRDGKQVKYWRFHFGEQDPSTKKMSGKNMHPYNAMITDDTHPRFEGPRDHPRLIMNIKTKLITSLANCDTQPIIDDSLIALQKYIAGYACKGGASTEDLLLIYKKLLQSCEANTSVRSLAQRLLMKMIGIVDISGAAADYMNVSGKLHHSTRRIRKIGISGYRLIAPGNDGNATRETPQYADWPVSEDFAKAQLTIHSKTHWLKPEDLKGSHYSFMLHLQVFWTQLPVVNEACKNSVKKRGYELLHIIITKVKMKVTLIVKKKMILMMIWS